jgi:hypothetical protein
MQGRTVKIQFSSADASTAAAISLFDDNDATVTLAANERLIIDSLTASLASAVTTVTVFSDDDADAAVDAGERIVVFSPGNGFFGSGEEGYAVPIGKTVKVKASGAGQVDITGTARIIKGKSEGQRPSWRESQVPS